MHSFPFLFSFHIRFISPLPARDPAMDCLQGWIIIKPVTGALISSSQVRHDMLIREASQILMEGGSCALQLGRWIGAAENAGAGHGPSSGCGGAQVDFVRLESACAAVQYDSVERPLAS